jgi:hypothetical protein
MAMDAAQAAQLPSSRKAPQTTDSNNNSDRRKRNNHNKTVLPLLQMQLGSTGRKHFPR